MPISEIYIISGVVKLFLRPTKNNLYLVRLIQVRIIEFIIKSIGIQVFFYVCQLENKKSYNYVLMGDPQNLVGEYSNMFRENIIIKSYNPTTFSRDATERGDKGFRIELVTERVAKRRAEWLAERVVDRSTK